MIRRPPSSPLSPYAPLFGSLPHGLADLDGAAGQPPLPAVGALLQKEPTATIEDDRRRARPNAQGPLPIGFERDPGGHPTRRLRCPQGQASLKRGLNCSQAIGATAAAAMLSSTWASVFIPTSAVPIPGVERTNWIARWASVE